MSSSTKKSKRSARRPARFTEDGDGTENNSKRRAAVISATTGPTSTSLSTSAPSIAENDLRPRHGTPPTTDVTVTASACVSTAPNPAATITMTECPTAAPASLIQAPFTVSNIPMPAFGGMSAAPIMVADTITTTPQNSEIATNTVAASGGNAYSEDNPVDNPVDNPTTTAATKTGQDSEFVAAVTESLATNTAAGGKNSLFDTTDAVAASGEATHSDSEDNRKLPAGVSLAVYQNFVSTLHSNQHVKEVDMDNGL